jgi:hypothetical protein
MTSDGCAQQGAGTTCPPLPPEIQGAVTAAVPGCTLLAAPDLDQGMQRFLLNRRALQHPSWSAGDFDGDGRCDYAVLLLAQGAGSCELTVAAILSRDDSGWQTLIMDEVELPRAQSGNCPVEVYVTTVGAGTVVSETAAPPREGTPRVLRLANDAVGISLFERSEKIVFLSHGVINSMWTSD